MARRQRSHYLLQDNHGKRVSRAMRFNGFDPVPKLQIGDRKLELARPLKWYEYAWLVLPLVVMVTGGALGVICGLPVLYSSTRIFRSPRGALQKFLMTGAVWVVSVLTFVVGAILVGVLIDAH